MSTVAISYSDLHDASQQAHKVSKFMDDYADELEKHVLNKLNRYNGPWTGNLSGATNAVQAKINELHSDATRFQTYSDNLDDLRDVCDDTDKAVRSRIADITAEFKDANGIRNSAVENCLGYFFTSLGNSTSVGRYLGNGADVADACSDYIKEQIKVWYNYEGGKELIKAIVVDVLKIAGAIIAVVAAAIACVASGGVLAVIALVSACVLLVMAAVDVGVDLGHEIVAYEMGKNPQDAAMATRLRDISSFSSFMRNGIITDEYDQTAFNQAYGGRRLAANIWDGVKIACTVANIVCSLPSAVSNITTLSYGISFGEITTLSEALITLEIGGLEISSVIISLTGSILDDGFQVSDLFNIDAYGILPSVNDLFTSDFWNGNDRVIDVKVLDKLKTNSGLVNNLDIRINIPKISIPEISIPQICMPVIQVPHIPVMSFSY